MGARRDGRPGRSTTKRGRSRGDPLADSGGDLSDARPIEQVAEALRVRQVALGARGIEKVASVQALGQLGEHRHHVAEVPGGAEVPKQIERRGFRRRDVHRAGLGLDRQGGRALDVPLQEEADPRAAGHSGSELRTRDHLELLRLLVRGTVDGRRAQDGDVVRLVVERHQLVDEPARRRRAGRTVLDRHNHVETAARHGKASLLHKPAGSLLQCLRGDAEGRERLLSSEHIAARGLVRIDQIGQAAVILVWFCKHNRPPCGSFGIQDRILSIACVSVNTISYAQRDSERPFQHVRRMPGSTA